MFPQSSINVWLEHVHSYCHSLLFLYSSRLMHTSVVVSQDLKVYTVRWTSMSVPVDPVRMEVSAMIRLMATYAGALQVCCWQVMASVIPSCVLLLDVLKELIKCTEVTTYYMNFSIGRYHVVLYFICLAL